MDNLDWLNEDGSFVIELYYNSEKYIVGITRYGKGNIIVDPDDVLKLVDDKYVSYDLLNSELCGIENKISRIM